jgi:nitrogen PTS system EIIA component
MTVAVENAPYVCILHAKTKEEAIAELVEELDVDHKRVYEAIMHREKVISTGIGIGIAIPHAKISGILEFSVVIGIIQHEGINWDAIDHLPVKLVMLICGPDDRHKEYLSLLSELTKKIKLESVRQALFSCKNREEVVKIFEEC